MITKITGTLNRVLDDEVRLQVGAMEYQVLVPDFVRRQLRQNRVRSGANVLGSASHAHGPVISQLHACLSRKSRGNPCARRHSPA